MFEVLVLKEVYQLSFHDLQPRGYNVQCVNKVQLEDAILEKLSEKTVSCERVGGGGVANQRTEPQLIELYQPTEARRQLHILLRHNYLPTLQAYFTGQHNCFQTTPASPQTS